MNDRQKRFAEYYAKNGGNATAAAVAAGYSSKTAYSQGGRLLKDVEVVAYIRQLQDEAASPRIASLTQAKAFWSDVMNDESQKMADRLKASELLARAAGAFLPARPDDTEDADSEDVVIYLPENFRA